MQHALRVVAVLFAGLWLVLGGASASGGEPGTPGEKGSSVADLERLAAAGSPLKDGAVVVFFGDSITQAGGYIAMLKERLDAARPGHGVRLVNRGHGGYCVPDLRPLLQREVLDEKPDLVVIYIGVNDVWRRAHGRGTPEEEYEAGLRDLLSRCREAGVPVVLCSPSIIGEFPRGSNPLDEPLDAYAKISERVAAEEKAVFCDLRGPFFAYLSEHKTDRSDRGVLTNDGVHMLPAGDRLLIETMAGGMVRALAG